jgi:hypothetical protein
MFVPLHRKPRQDTTAGARKEIRAAAVLAAVASGLVGAIVPAALNAGTHRLHGGETAAAALWLAGLATAVGVVVARAIGRRGKV